MSVAKSSSFNDDPLSSGRFARRRSLELCREFLHLDRPRGVEDGVWFGCRRLLQLRLEMGLSQRQFAQLADMRVASYCSIERGRTHPLLAQRGLRESPWIPRVISVCETLCVQPEEVWSELAPDPPVVCKPLVSAWTARASRSSSYLEALLALQAAWPALRHKPRYAEVTRAYYGLNKLGAATLQEVGDSFGITRERVRQINNRALRLLRAQLQHDEAVAEVEAQRKPHVSPRMRLQQQFRALLQRPVVRRVAQFPVLQPALTLRQRNNIHKRDLGHAADKRAAAAPIRVNRKHGLSLSEALAALPGIWELCRRRILCGLSGVLRSAREERLLLRARLHTGADAPNPASYPGVADAVLIFPLANDYLPFPMGEDAWVDVRQLRVAAAKIGFVVSVAPPLCIAFFWQGAST